MQHASDNWWVGGLVVALSILIVSVIVFAQHRRAPSIRRISGLNAVDDAVGRATEMGRPVLMVPGLDGLSISTLQALSIFSHIARSVGRFGNRTIVATNDPLVTGIAEETIRDAYADSGRPELFDGNDIRYLSSQQFAFATGVAGILIRDKVAASFLFGGFYAESLIFAEVGNQVGAIQVAGTTQTTQIPFLIAACDHVIIGDEFYAASAYLSKAPTLLGSLVGQDYCKLVLLLIAVFGSIGTSILVKHPGPHHTGWLSCVQWFVDLFKA